MDRFTSLLLENDDLKNHCKHCGHRLIKGQGTPLGSPVKTRLIDVPFWFCKHCKKYTLRKASDE